jgi:hypothetical protein
MFDMVDNKDDIFNTADNDNGDDADKKSINNQEDTVDAVEDNGDDSNTVKKTTSEIDRFFFESLALTYRPFFS